jgi:hypothetical protein
MTVNDSSFEPLAVSPRPAAAWRVWLSNPTLMLCMAGIVLPNALSLGALIAGIGAPPRTSAILAYATLAIAARITPPMVTVILYLVIAAYDAISTIALLFNLSPHEIGLALHLSAELKVLQSPFYVSLIVSLIALLGANIAFLTLKRNLLQRGNALILMGVAALFATTDFISNTSAHYQFGTLYGIGRPVESAIDESGFRMAVAGRGPQRVLVVMVEALGHFADPDKQALLLEPLRSPALLKRYDVTNGMTTYFGSTTAAEMRELCHSREPYQALLDGKAIDCLPAQMARRGFRTVGIHNFTGAFFDRNAWYPKLGFHERIFGEQLVGAAERRCGGPFRGICDQDVIPTIAKTLQDAQQPTFVYWMTLSTHVPIAPHEGTPRFGCAQSRRTIGQADVCYMTEMWVDLMQALAKLTADIPPTEILIVGDHAPPLWSKAGRHLFTPGKVTWVRMTPRSNAVAARTP